MAVGEAAFRGSLMDVTSESEEPTTVRELFVLLGEMAKESRWWMVAARRDAAPGLSVAAAHFLPTTGTPLTISKCQDICLQLPAECKT